MRYACRMIDMMRLIVSWVDDLNFDEIRFALSANLELWISYTRFLLSIEVSWDNNVRFDQLLNQLLKSYELVFICCIHETWRIVVIAIFALWNFMTWRITVIVIFASNILSFFSISSQFALKIWKSSSWLTQKKHDLMIRTVCCFRYRKLNFLIDDWQLIEWQWDLNLSLYLLFFLLSVLKSKSCKTVRRNRVA